MTLSLRFASRLASASRWPLLACCALAPFFSPEQGGAAPGAAVQSAGTRPQDRGRFDAVVYGSTPGGIAMAVRLAREGRSVLLVGHAKRLGGMPSYGLGAVDSLYQGPRAPFFNEWISAVHAHYLKTYGPDSEQYKSSRPDTPNVRVESKVAERIFGEMIAREKRITVQTGFYPVAVDRDGVLLRAATFQSMQGQEQFSVTAAVFADCSYEGDLAAVAKVPYRVGREGRAEFNEEHAGRLFMRDVPWPPKGVNPAYLAQYRKLNLIPHVERWSEIIYPESTGEGDKSVQTYVLRILLSEDPNNSVPIAKPDGYDREEFLLRLNKNMGFWRPSSRGGDIPNKKRFILQPELIGLQDAYVEGTWAERKKIVDAHRAATLSLLYFYQNDPSLSAEIREAWSKIGLPKDEFADSDNLPDEIYVREARRIIGRTIFTEHNARLAPGQSRAPIVPDSIGIAEWYLDSHAVTPERLEGSLWEGEHYLRNKTWPSQISLGTILPRGTDNLLVPICVSATHVGFGTIRVEPVWMSISEAAAYLADEAIKRGASPAAVPADDVVQRLAGQRFLISFFNDIAAHVDAEWYPAVQYLGTKGFFGGYDARPTEPLAAPLARTWLKAVAALRSGAPYDAANQARECWRLEQQAAPAISRGEFQRALREVIGSSSDKGSSVNLGSATGDAPITRAAASVLIFAALERNTGRP